MSRTLHFEYFKLEFRTVHHKCKCNYPAVGRQSDLDTIRQSNYSRRGRSSWKSNSYRGDRHDSGPNPRSRLNEDDDGDFEMEGGSASSHSRRYMTVALTVLFLGKSATKLPQACLSAQKKVLFNMFLFVTWKVNSKKLGLGNSTRWLGRGRWRKYSHQTFLHPHCL